MAEELTDEQVFDPHPKPGELTDADVFGSSRGEPDFSAAPSQAAEGWQYFFNTGGMLSFGPTADPETVPEAFRERLRRGASVERALKRISAGFAEGYGPEPLGISPEHVQQLQDIGILTDYTRYPYGRLGPISVLGDATINATINTLEFLMRATNAGVHGAAGAFGQLVEELSSSEMQGMKAEHDVTGLGDYALIELGMGRYARIGAFGIIE